MSDDSTKTPADHVDMDDLRASNARRRAKEEADIKRREGYEKSRTGSTPGPA